MHAPPRLAPSRIFPTRLARAAAAFAVLAASAPALVGQQIQAFYPLATDLLDVTTNYGPMSLLGTPPPAPPSNGVCVNGVYYFGGGQDVRTPLLTSLDTTDFEIDVEFNITALPTFQGPVIMGGDLWRWLGIYLQANGTVGVKHNNSNLAWSTTTLSPGQWYSASLKYEAGTVVLLIDNALVLHANV